jgi:hypothetical protein
MTVKELKEAIENLSDDMHICFQDMSDKIQEEEHPYFDIEESTVEYVETYDDEVLVLF